MPVKDAYYLQVEKNNNAQVRHPPEPEVKIQLAPLNATNGTQDNRLSPFFPNPDSGFVSGDFTTNPSSTGQSHVL